MAANGTPTGDVSTTKPESPQAPAPTPPTLTREEQLDRALAKGRLDDLPPNEVQGLLGEKNPKLRVTDMFEPDLNAGVSQEMDLPVVWMGIVLAYLLFFPVAYWLLWRTTLISHRAKTVVSAVGAVGIAYVTYRLIAG
jgi:hypothetical protein